MVKTNAERQAEYRLRQRGLGDKKRLNIWLSEQAHNELSVLAKQKGMSKQVFIEWLLTNDSMWRGETVSREQNIAVTLSDDVKKLPRNSLQKNDSDKKIIKKGRVDKLQRNSVSEAAARKGEERSDHPAKKEPESPLPAQFELQL